MKTLLIIAGSDPSGGAGVQADIKTACAFGVFATTAITAITVQNTTGVSDIHDVPASIVRAQIEAVLSDIGADAIKIGMLHRAEIIQTVAESLAAHRDIPVILDPVMVATSGDMLLEDSAKTALTQQLFPLSRLITPNLPEATALLESPTNDAAEAATALQERFDLPAVLVKGGHGAEDELVDILVDETGTHEYRAARQDTQHTHGTGCTLASAIACGVAQGHSLPSAVGTAHAYVQHAISAAPGLGHGHGPLGHGVDTT